AAVLKECERIVATHEIDATIAQTSFSDVLPVSAGEVGVTDRDDALPSRLLSFIADRCNPVEWTGDAWEPKDTGTAVTHAELFGSIGHPEEVSRALDELL